MPGKKFLTPKEVAFSLGVSASTVSRRIKDKTIPTVLFGGMRLIPASFIDDLEGQATRSSSQEDKRGAQP